MRVSWDTPVDVAQWLKYARALVAARRTKRALDDDGGTGKRARHSQDSDGTASEDESEMNASINDLLSDIVDGDDQVNASRAAELIRRREARDNGDGEGDIAPTEPVTPLERDTVSVDEDSSESSEEVAGVNPMTLVTAPDLALELIMAELDIESLLVLATGIPETALRFAGVGLTPSGREPRKHRVSGREEPIVITPSVLDQPAKYESIIPSFVVIKALFDKAFGISIERINADERIPPALQRRMSGELIVRMGARRFNEFDPKPTVREKIEHDWYRLVTAWRVFRLMYTRLAGVHVAGVGAVKPIRFFPMLVDGTEPVSESDQPAVLPAMFKHWIPVKVNRTDPGAPLRGHDVYSLVSILDICARLVPVKIGRRGARTRYRTLSDQMHIMIMPIHKFRRAQFTLEDYHRHFEPRGAINEAPIIDALQSHYGELPPIGQDTRRFTCMGRTAAELVHLSAKRGESLVRIDLIDLAAKSVEMHVELTADIATATFGATSELSYSHDTGTLTLVGFRSIDPVDQISVALFALTGNSRVFTIARSSFVSADRNQLVFINRVDGISALFPPSFMGMPMLKTELHLPRILAARPIVETGLTIVNVLPDGQIKPRQLTIVSPFRLHPTEFVASGKRGLFSRRPAQTEAPGLAIITNDGQFGTGQDPKLKFTLMEPLVYQPTKSARHIRVFSTNEERYLIADPQLNIRIENVRDFPVEQL